MKKIKSNSTLVLLHGDEMAEIAFQKIIKQFINKHLDIKLYPIDLSAVNRIRTNGQIVKDAEKALKTYKVGVKNAGITVNKEQLENFVSSLQKEENFPLSIKELNKLATASPNGYLRSSIDGNILRKDIEFANLKKNCGNWKNIDIKVTSPNAGGMNHSLSFVSPEDNELELIFVDELGNKKFLHNRKVKSGDPICLANYDKKHLEEWAQSIFETALKEKRNIYFSSKDTVLPNYDGVVKEIVENIYQKYKAKLSNAGLEYKYGLIDSVAAKIVVSPPTHPEIFAIADNATAVKMEYLINHLTKYGISENFSPTIARMSGGGGDQYGSYNFKNESPGKIFVKIGKFESELRTVNPGDPVILMTNSLDAIKFWLRQVETEANISSKPIYFGFDSSDYDHAFAKLTVGRLKNKHYTIIPPEEQLVKMVVNPTEDAIYACMNLDGDIYSDIAADLGGSLATASSAIFGTDNIALFEAPHGTAPGLFKKYNDSNGKIALFNPTALIYAFAESFRIIANNENNQELKNYSDSLIKALIKTVDDGYITPDLKGKTTIPDSEKIVDMYEFLDRIEGNL